jgi:hypothetical protein
MVLQEQIWKGIMGTEKKAKRVRVVESNSAAAAVPCYPNPSKPRRSCYHAPLPPPRHALPIALENKEE